MRVNHRLLLAALWLSGCATTARRSDAPSLLLVNAHVVTLDAAQPTATAVAIHGGVIAWLGDSAEAVRRFPDASKVIDLRQATLLPGLIDAHTHLQPLGEALVRLDVRGLATPDEVAARVAARAKRTPPGEWIIGWGWDEGQWADHYPTHELLDRAAPDHPVYLVGLHTFASWANQRALDAAHIDRAAKDPEGGTILRDAHGAATGVLLNKAQALLRASVPPLTLGEAKEAIRTAAEECVRHGLTSVHEAMVSSTMLEAYRELIAEKRMPLRIYAMLDGADAALVDTWLARGPELGSRLTVRAIKLFADGALGSRGAALLAPYTDKPDTLGTMTMSASAIEALARRGVAAGFQLATHAIGDAANRAVLDAYERGGATDKRFRIEHAQVVSATDVPRFQQLGVIASMQPAHCTSDMAWAEQRIGRERLPGAYAWRSLLEAGAHVALGSDFPGESHDPFRGMYSAVTRKSPEHPEGPAFTDGQRLSVEEALRGYTIEGAYAELTETTKGSVTPGKYADLVVIERDPRSAPAEVLLDTRVLLTIVDGEIVFDGRGSLGDTR